MSRTLTVLAGATAISAVQRQALKTSDDLYFYDSESNLVYVKISETAMQLLNNILTMGADSRSAVVLAEDRTYVV